MKKQSLSILTVVLGLIFLVTAIAAATTEPECNVTIEANCEGYLIEGTVYGCEGWTLQVELMLSNGDTFTYTREFPAGSGCNNYSGTIPGAWGDLPCGEYSVEGSLAVVGSDCLVSLSDSFVCGCDDENPCTIDYCDESGMCVNETKDCDDNDRCTDDYCDIDTGLCINEDNDMCEECPPAYPKTQGYWQHQCRALGLIGNSNGNVRLHEAWMGELDTIEEICDNLDATPNDMCSKARKQLQALMLNSMSERVADCNCILPGGTVGDAIESIEEMIDAGMCIRANNLADGINRGYLIIECPND